MRRLRARFNGRAALLSVAVGIAMGWTQALGNGTPDEEFIVVPEPATLSLFAAGIAGVIILDQLRRRK